MDARLGILIEENFDSVNAAWDAHEKKVLAGIERINAAHTSGSQKRVQASKEVLTNIQTVGQTEIAWHDKSTKALNEYIYNLRTKKIDAINAGIVASEDAGKRQIQQYAAELRALNQINLARKETQERGAGVMNGVLGIGREIFGANLFGGPMGGSALIGKFEGVKNSITEITGATEGAGTAMKLLGTSVGVAGAAVAAFTITAGATVGVFKLLEDNARKYEEGQDALAISLTRSGLRGKDLRDEIRYMSKDVDELSIAFVRPRKEIAETMAHVAAFSRTGGEQLKKLTELSIGVAEATGMSADQVARLIGKVADPEIITNAAQRYGIVIDKHMNQIQRIDALEKQYGGTVDELKDRMKEGVHTWDQLVIVVQNAAQKFALKEFNQLGPTFADLTPKVEHFVDSLSEIKLQPAIDRLTKIYHVFRDIYKGVSDIIGTISGSHRDIAQGVNHQGDRVMQGFDYYAKNTPIFQNDRLQNTLAAFGELDEANRAEIEAKIASPEAPPDKEAGKKAYEAAIDARREALSVQIADLTKNAKSQEEIKDKLRDAEIQFDADMVEIAKKFHEKTGSLEETYQKALLAKREQGYKDQAEAQKKADEEFVKIWDERLRAMEERTKKEEELLRTHAAKAKEIQTRLEDWQDSSIEDKTKKEIAEENRKYSREKDTILKQADGTKEMHDLIDKELQQLEAEHQQKLVDIADDGTKKTAKSYDFLKEALKDLSSEFRKNSSEAAQWGQLVGDVVLFLMDKLFSMGSGKKNPATATGSKVNLPIPGLENMTGDYLTQNIGAMLAGFHDTPGTLDSLAGRGTIPVGNGKFMVVGDGQDRLVRGYKDGDLVSQLGAMWFNLDPQESQREKSRKAREQDKKYGMLQEPTIDPIEIGAGMVEGGLRAGVKGAVKGLIKSHPVTKMLAEVAEGGGSEALKDSAKHFLGEIVLQNLGHVTNLTRSSVLGGNAPIYSSSDATSYYRSRGNSGYSRGEYTGYGNPSEVAGFVHKDEFVFSSPAVRRIGVERLRALHSWGKGYDGGGEVSIESQLLNEFLHPSGKGLTSSLAGANPASALTGGNPVLSAMAQGVGLLASISGDNHGLKNSLTGMSSFISNPLAHVFGDVGITMNKDHQQFYHAPVYSGRGFSPRGGGMSGEQQPVQVMGILDQNLQRLSANQSLIEERRAGS